MNKIVLKSGYYFKGEILSEDSSKVTLKDIKGGIVEITKSEIAVRLVYDDKTDT